MKMENATYQNLWDAAKAVLTRKFKAIEAYLKKTKSQINNLTLHLTELEEEQAKPKGIRKKEITKSRNK